MDAAKLEELKFHWDKWKSESKAFFGRAVLVIPILTGSILFQWQAISVKIPGVERLSTGRPLYLFVWVQSMLLWFFLCFKFLDLFRHRVPDDLEKCLHTDQVPNPYLRSLAGWLPASITRERIDLAWYGSMLWFVFVIYLAFVGVILLATVVHLLWMSI